MPSSMPMRAESVFMRTHVPLLLQRFSLSCHRETSCIEYFINRCGSPDCISSSLVFCYNAVRRDLHVSRFHPELCHEPESKYLSAACFYLMVHHCARIYDMPEGGHISLETVPTVSDRFYLRLRDFNFHVVRFDLGNVVLLESDLVSLPVDTGMIAAHVFRGDELPFLRE